MRIVLFTDTLADLNGVSRFIQDMAQNAREGGHELFVLTSTHKSVPRHPNLINLPPKMKLPMPYYPEMAICLPPKAALIARAEELKPDIIHISTPGLVGLVGKAFARDFDLPMVGTYHTDFPAFVLKNSGMMLFKRIADRVMGRFHKPFERLIARSESYRSIIAREIGYPADRIFTLPAGTRTTHFHPCHRDLGLWQRYPLMREGALKALFVGRVGMDKNVPFLLKAWSIYQKEYARKDRPVDLVIIGEGRLIKEAAQHRAIHAHMIGPVVDDALLAHYASADFFLFPSVTDTLGQVIMEAQASGLPVVVSDMGGPKSLLSLQGEPTGIVARAEDTEAWVEAIRALVDQADLRLQMGQAAHKSMQPLAIDRSFEAFWDLHLKVAQKVT